MQFSASRDAGTSRGNGDSQKAEGLEDALVAVMEDDAPAGEAMPPERAVATTKQRARSTDHPEVFTVDLLGSWFKP
jgi:hypothetical protein